MVQVPERFFQDFESEFPSLATLADPATDRSLVFAQGGLHNLIKYTTHETALRIEAINIPGELGAAAGVLFDQFNGYVAGIGGMQTVSLPEALIDAVDGFQAMAQAVGAFESVPIVGMILDFAMTAIEGGITAYKFKHDERIEAMGWGYNREVDQDWTRETLAYHGGRDLTGIFLPANDASDGIEILNTEIDTSGLVDTTARALYIPRGPGTTNIGALPNTRIVPRGSEMNYAWNPRTRPHGIPWSHFLPSTSQGVLGSWQSILSNSRACYLVDAVRVAKAWNTWQDNMVMWGWGTRYKGNDRIRMSMLSRPPVPYDVQQRIGQDGYRRIVPYWPGDGMTQSGGTQGSKLHYGPLLGDVGAWAAEVQLGRRQREYLGTLTVAYCSEHDPAFESDPLLADLLMERRELLLGHPAVELVELGQVVDDDFRQAVALRQGPGGLVDAPKGAPSGPGAIAGSIPKSQRLPPVFAMPPAKATPFLTGPGGRSYSQGGDSLKNAALLALLGFLVK